MASRSCARLRPMSLTVASVVSAERSHSVATPRGGYASCVWSLGEVGNGVVAGGIIADLALEGARGRYQGAFSWAFAVGRLLAPVLVTALIAAGGRCVICWTVLVVGLAAAALVARLAPQIAERGGRR